ncbi:MAG: hypothetical protein IJR85_08430 [Synergistaceae bacterium]|nr:hypothetical protein [Synergistaceae bacterium]
MKKLLGVALLVLLLAGIAGAEVKIDLDNYQCVICKDTFLTFKGDPLEKLKVEEQPGKVFLLSDRGKNPKNCANNFKMHRYVKTGTRNVSMELIAQNMDRILVIKGGGSLSQKVLTWKCLLCGKEFCSFDGFKLNIKDWDIQPDFIKSLKGMKGIPQCSARSQGYFGHVFKLSKEGPINSYDFAGSMLNQMYYVKGQ